MFETASAFGTPRLMTELVGWTRAPLEDSALHPLPALSVQILVLAREHGRVTPAEAARATGSSRNTVKYHLARLTEQGHLTRHGAGRGTWYGLG